MADEQAKWIEKYREAFEKAKGSSGRDPKWAGVTCAEADGKACRLCDMVWKIVPKKRRHLYSQETFTKAKEFIRQFKYFANVVLKAEPEVVRILEYPQSIQDDFWKAAMGKDEGGNDRFYSYKHGKNVVILKSGEQRDTSYSVRFKERSPFPTKFATMAWNLDDVIALRQDGHEAIMRAAQLQGGPNEMRVLGRWDNPEDDAALFFFMWQHHMGITQEMYDAIQAGEYNPFAEEGFDIPTEDPKYDAFGEKEDDVPMFGNDEGGNLHASFDNDDDKAFTEPDEEVVEDAKPEPKTSASIDPDTPACYGNYEPDDDECTDCPNGTDCLTKTRG